MKKTNAELMKELKEVQRLITFALARERDAAITVYTEADKEVITSSFNYSKSRSDIYALQKEELKLKDLLAKSNATTMVKGFDFTIATALVRLGQLSKTKFTLQRMAAREELVREISYGKTRYERVNYDLVQAQTDLAAVTEEIAKLQMAIDLTNLTNEIEVS